MILVLLISAFSLLACSPPTSEDSNLIIPATQDTLPQINDSPIVFSTSSEESEDSSKGNIGNSLLVNNQSRKISKKDPEFTFSLTQDKFSSLDISRSSRLNVLPDNLSFQQCVIITLYSDFDSHFYGAVSFRFISESLSSYNKTYYGKQRAIILAVPYLEAVEDYSFDLSSDNYGRRIDAQVRFSVVSSTYQKYTPGTKGFDVSYSFSGDKLSFSNFTPFLEYLYYSNVKYYTIEDEEWLGNNLYPYNFLESKYKSKALTYDYEVYDVYIIEGVDININLFAYDENSGMIFEYGMKTESFFYIWYHWWIYFILAVGVAIIIGGVSLICICKWDRIMRCLGCRKDPPQYIFNQAENNNLPEQGQGENQIYIESDSQNNNNNINQPLIPENIQPSSNQAFNFPSRESVDNKHEVVDINKRDSK